MSIIDIILAGILLYGLVKGGYKGLFVELASLISLLLGIYLSVRFSGFTVNFIREKFSFDSEYLEIIAFAVTFILVMVGTSLLAKVFTKIVNSAGLGWVNRMLGAFHGLVKIIFILGIFLHFFQKINVMEDLISENKLNQSILYNLIVKTSEFIFSVIFESLKEKLR